MAEPSFGVRAYAQPSMNEFAPYTNPLVPVVLQFPFTHEDLDATTDQFLAPIDKGLIIESVALEIVTAFSVATAVIVGTAADDNAFILTGVVDPASAGAFANSAGGAAANAIGSTAFRSAAGNIVVQFNDDPLAGAGVLYVKVWATAPSKREALADTF